MGLQQDVSPYGSQTVMGPGWPNVDEDALAAAAAQYEALAAKLSGSVVPLQQSQLMSLSDSWTGRWCGRGCWGGHDHHRWSPGSCGSSGGDRPEAAQHGGHRRADQGAGQRDRHGDAA